MSRVFLQVRFESLNFFDASFSASQGSVLALTCRKKIKEMMLGSADEKHEQWLKLVAGRRDMAIAVTIYNAKVVAIGPGCPDCDMQLVDGACTGSDMTLADVKRELEQKHGVKWNDQNFDYCLRKLRDGQAAEKIEDDGELLQSGALLLLFPANPKQLLQLPPVLFSPPAEKMEIDGTHVIPVNVKAIDSDSELYFDLLLPRGCTAQQLRQLLHDEGVPWALDGAKVLSFSNKLIKNDSVIPATCELPLKVVQAAR
jgi:hypothetical protein